MTKTIKALAVLGVVAGLGVAALPIAGASAAEKDTTDDPITNTSSVSDDTTFTLDLEDKLSINASTNAVTFNPATTGAVSGLFNADDMTVTVITRNSGGYKLTMVGSAGTDQNNAKTVNALTNEKGDEIIAGNVTGTAASTWGFKVATNINGTETAAGTEYKGVAAADGADAVIMQSTTTTKATGDVATLTFGANIIDGQAAGTYKGKVTFTATNQPKVTEP